MFYEGYIEHRFSVWMGHPWMQNLQSGLKAGFAPCPRGKIRIQAAGRQKLHFNSVQNLHDM
ncbi:MAG: hypothetical protein ACYCXO_14795 [Candidatus Humimicrobiaceae bacterium]